MFFERGARTTDQRSRKTEIAAWIAVEAGKTRSEAMVEADELQTLLGHYAAVGRDPGAFVDPLGNSQPQAHSRSVLRPYGVLESSPHSTIRPFKARAPLSQLLLPATPW